MTGLAVSRFDYFNGADVRVERIKTPAVVSRRHNSTMSNRIYELEDPPTSTSHSLHPTARTRSTATCVQALMTKVTNPLWIPLLGTLLGGPRLIRTKIRVSRKSPGCHAARPGGRTATDSTPHRRPRDRGRTGVLGTRDRVGARCGPDANHSVQTD